MQRLSQPRPWALPYIALFIALVADGLIKQVFNFSAASYAPLVATIAIFGMAGWIFYVGRRRAMSVNLPPLLLIGVIAVVGWSAIELVNPWRPFRSSAVTVAFARLVPMCCLWLAPVLLPTRESRRTVFRVWVILAALSAIFGIYEYVLGPTRVAAFGPGFNPFRAGNPWFSHALHTFVLRPGSVFSAPALAGEFAATSLLPAGWLVMDSSRRWRGIAVITIVLSTLFVFIGGIRALSLQLIVLLVLLGASSIRLNRRAVVIAGAGVATLIVAYAASPAFSERLTTAFNPTSFTAYLSPSQAVTIMLRDPVGRGLGTSADPSENLQFENYYVLLNTDGGLVGVATMSLTILAAALLAARGLGRREDNQSRFLAISFAAYTVSLLFVMNTALTLDKPTAAFPFWTLAGLVLAAPRLGRSVGEFGGAAERSPVATMARG